MEHITLINPHVWL